MKYQALRYFPFSLKANKISLFLHQFQVQKAREIIQMESSQPCTLEERLGKSTQQPGGEGGTKESYIKNQFSTWDFPKPGASQEEEGTKIR
jgi:hypothetical protein